MRLKSLVSSLFISLLMLTNAPAQETPATRETKEDREKAQHELESKTLKLLDSTLAEAQQLKLTENRVLFQSVAADLLWNREEKRARVLFQDAVNSLATRLPSSDPRTGGGDSYWSLARLRSQTLRMVARHDPQFALELLRASRPDNPEGADPGMLDQELNLVQEIAGQAIETDPKRALAIAQESLKKGISFGLLSLLNRLQQKDSEAATRLASDIVKKIQTENPAADGQAYFVAMELLRTVLHSEGDDPDGVSQGNKERKGLTLDDATIRDLAEAVIGPALTASGNSSNLLVRLQDVLPDLEKRLPERAPQLRQRFAEINQSPDPEGKAWIQFGTLVRNGSPDAILAAAAEAPPQIRKTFYQMAAGKLMESGEVERARKIVTDNLNGAERDQFLAEIDRMAIANDGKQGKVDEARKIISRLATREMRASAYAELAVNIMAAQADRKLALEVLDEARKLISNPAENQKQIDALLQVARAYALVEPSRTFDLIDPLIDQANEMLAAAALLDKFGAAQGFFKKGEILLQNGFLQANGPYLQHLIAVASLARADFEHTKATVSRFQRSEVRLMACLLIAQSVLSDRLGKEKAAERYFSNGFTLSQ